MLKLTQRLVLYFANSTISLSNTIVKNFSTRILSRGRDVGYNLRRSRGVGEVAMLHKGVPITYAMSLQLMDRPTTHPMSLQPMERPCNIRIINIYLARASKKIICFVLIISGFIQINLGPTYVGACWHLPSHSGREGG